MKILEAAENYLEIILIEQEKLGHVRSIDICNAMNYSKPTISVMMKQLRENGYIDMDRDGYITLTDKGSEIALKIYERHELLAKMLISLGVDEETAYHDACKIEHDISEVTFDMLKAHYYKVILNK
ncbi:iron (metal) dependent repressor, DtxR family [Sporobacter termitidis DSM 10068]|uniref:Iron (Metal) dependent repressor, DtxR family n=1 Tax=Sporobacter termitidis DSM 10068 TaxID=1123282 RepID=A0A1M5Z0T3_9FIRM|nr:metal-dependent transcriptional regulator [Sporobacter termitidis]SHI17907.1 iron (metal) dependent repressor, DtxR family [Sporobacter termitidis DSM 10068]